MRRIVALAVLAVAAQAGDALETGVLGLLGD